MRVVVRQGFYCIMYLTVKTSSDANILQNDLHALEKWEQDLTMEFNSDKCEVLHK